MCKNVYNDSNFDILKTICTIMLFFLRNILYEFLYQIIAFAILISELYIGKLLSVIVVIVSQLI